MKDTINLQDRMTFNGHDGAMEAGRKQYGEPWVVWVTCDVDVPFSCELPWELSDSDVRAIVWAMLQLYGLAKNAGRIEGEAKIRNILRQICGC